MPAGRGDTGVSPVCRAVPPGPPLGGRDVSVRTPRPSGVTGSPGSGSRPQQAPRAQSHLRRHRFPGADRGDPSSFPRPGWRRGCFSPGVLSAMLGARPRHPLPCQRQGPGPRLGAGLQPLPPPWEPRGERRERRPGGLGAASVGGRGCVVASGCRGGLLETPGPGHGLPRQRAPGGCHQVCTRGRGLAGLPQLRRPRGDLALPASGLCSFSLSPSPRVAVSEGPRPQGPPGSFFESSTIKGLGAARPLCPDGRGFRALLGWRAARGAILGSPQISPPPVNREFPSHVAETG